MMQASEGVRGKREAHSCGRCNIVGVVHYCSHTPGKITTFTLGISILNILISGAGETVIYRTFNERSVFSSLLHGAGSCLI